MRPFFARFLTISEFVAPWLRQAILKVRVQDVTGPRMERIRWARSGNVTALERMKGEELGVEL